MKLGERLEADVAVIGGGVGGCAAALAACRLGKHVVMTEQTAWVGGQFTSQGVPPDEHRWIEHFGASASYRRLRNLVRDYYRRNFPLSERALGARYFDPGNSECTTLAAEPRAFLAALHELLAPFIHSGRLRVLTGYRPVAVDTAGDTLTEVRVSSDEGELVDVSAQFFLDATELGDLLPLAGVEHRVGAESRDQTGEPHALPEADPRCMEAFTWCFAIDHLEGENHTIERPEAYAFFRDNVPPHWPGPQLSFVVLDYDTLGPWEHTFLPPEEEGPLWRSLWSHRRLIDARNFRHGLYRSDIILVNWTQNDYFLGPIIGVDEAEAEHHLNMARQLSLSLLYWLQTEAPRPDGGSGYPGLRLRPDVMGTNDGLAMHPYIRESRRIEAVFTLLEQHVSAETRPNGSELFHDSVGIGYYFLDMHQRTQGQRPFLVQTCPYQIPLGTLIPIRVRNLLPACKNIGVTHVVNSCTREHPIEWAVGEAAGTLAAYCINRKIPPQGVREREGELRDFQSLLLRQGVELAWPEIAPVTRWDEHLRYTVANRHVVVDPLVY